MTETEIQKRFQIAACKNKSIRLFRNQTGVYALKDGRYLQSGLAKGSADLIGWKTVEITPDMVGKKVAVFLSVEVKTPTGRLSEEQQNWLNKVNQDGGIALVARNPDDAQQI